jgi:hypothetical protein
VTRARLPLLAIRVLCSLVVACAVVAFAAPAFAATETYSWAPVANLPAGSAPANDQIYSSPTGGLMRYSLQSGTPSVAFFEAEGKLGTEQLVDGASSESQLGSVAFLPDGAAAISYVYNGTLDLVVREPNGAYGARFGGSNDDPIVAFAAREGEVMIAREDVGTTNFKPQIKVSSLTVEAGGFLTEAGTPTAIYEMPASDTYVAKIGSVGLALDADGKADLVMHTEGEGSSGGHNEVLDFVRSSAGTWGGARNLSAGLPEEATANGMQVVAAPGGRALLAFQTSKFPPINSGGADELATHVYESLREPGGTFSTPTQVASLSGDGGVEAKTQLAAGGDSTLALAVKTNSCQVFEDASEVPAETLSAYVAAPGKPLSGALGISIDDTAAGYSELTALGAGDGRAILGIKDEQTTSGFDNHVCGVLINENPEHGIYSDRGVLVGGSSAIERTFGSGEFDFGSYYPELLVDAGAVSSAGEVAVTGSLASSKGAEEDFYGSLSTTASSEETTTSTSNGTGGGTTSGTSGTSVVSTTTAATGTPAPSAPTPTIAPAQIAALLGDELVPSAKATKIATLVKKSSLAMPFKAPESGTAVIDWYELPPGASLTKKSKVKPVLVAAGKGSFGGAGSAQITIKLTAAGKRLLRRVKRVKLTAKGTFTPTGRASITTTRTFVLTG